MRYHYLLTGQNLEHWQYPILVRMWNNRKPHILLVGKQNSTANLEDTLLISYKIKQTLTIWSNSVFQGRSWKLMCTEHVHTDVHKTPTGSSPYKCQISEATKIPFSRWMDKTMTHPYKEISFSTHRKRAMKPWKHKEDP